MCDINSPTATASDSDFEEPDPTEDDEEDEDSIAPADDVAEDGEIDSLVKESQMSLADLLASYGVPVSEQMSIMSTSSNSSRRTRAKRRSADQVGAEPIKRTRSASQNSAASPAIDTAPDTNPSSTALGLHNTSESISTTSCSSLQPTDDNQSSSVTILTPCPVALSSSPTSPTTMDKPLIVNTTITSNIEPPTSPDAVVVHSPSSTVTTDRLDSLQPLDGVTVADPEDSNNSEEQQENYPARFWQRAIGAGESPPSYNSDDDEDYAPSSDSGVDWRGEIRVGDDYQAEVHSFKAPNPADNVILHRIETESSRLWQPNKLSEDQVKVYEQLFAQSIMFPLPTERVIDDEEALYLLMRCNYDLDEALQRLRFRNVHPLEIPGYMETWSETDSVAFEKGFALYSKNFRQIRETRLPHKTVHELVHYYYLWKKTARYDAFARVYRRDKRKALHPNMTDFMDSLVLEQQQTLYNSNFGVPSNVYPMNNNTTSNNMKHTVFLESDHRLLNNHTTSAQSTILVGLGDSDGE